MAPFQNQPPLRRRISRQSSRIAAMSLLSYLGIAYLLAPEFWTLRDGGAAGSFPAFLTATPQGIPGDPINLGLIGTRQELIHAFATAGWHAADELTWRTAVDIGESVIFDRPYADAPVSTLTFDGHAQDLAFEKPAGRSADTRHHVRFWQTDRTGDDGRPLWLGAASFDRGVGLSHDTGQITHHIGPDIDTERDGIIADLRAAGTLTSAATIEGIGPTQDGHNGGGDRYVTDGMIALGTLASGS
jgi:hypothetical protein